MTGKFDLQKFADFGEVVEGNEEAFKEMEGVSDQFSAISAKLGELGYDVLINNKESQEFVPKGRLDEVVGQRDDFKGKVDLLNGELETIKASAGDNQALKDQLDKMIGSNNKLLEDLDQATANNEILAKAHGAEAIDPKDLLVFINRDNLKKNSKGQWMGIDAEIARIKEEKPHLFGKVKSNKGGTDHNDDQTKGGVLNMNAAIRAAAGMKR